MKENNEKIDFAVGGQALIEGVLMRSPNFNIVSVRTPQGDITAVEEFYQNITARWRHLNVPIIRGVISMIEMLYIGTKALNFSSMASLGEIVAGQNAGANPSKSKGFWKESQNKSRFAGLAVIISMIIGLGLALFLFKFLPLWLTNTISTFVPALDNYLAYNLVDALIKTTIFVGYIYFMSLLPDIKRVFMYHGAEHKSIMTYEKGLDLTVENARNQTRFHPRCGTSFILLVFLVSILVFTLLPKNPDFVSNFLTRLAALPLVAGLSYEVLKLSAKHMESRLFSMVAAPGLLMQRLTTAEPDDSILEVALNSLKLALQAEQKFSTQRQNDN